MRNHVKAVAILHLVFSGFSLLIGLGLAVLMISGGWISGDQTVLAITSGLGLFLALLFLALSIPAVLGAIGTLKYRNWGRIVLIIVGILNIPGFPIGTALGAYTLWVLLHRDTEALFSR